MTQQLRRETWTDFHGGRDHPDLQCNSMAGSLHSSYCRRVGAMQQHHISKGDVGLKGSPSPPSISQSITKAVSLAGDYNKAVSGKNTFPWCGMKTCDLTQVTRAASGTGETPCLLSCLLDPAPSSIFPEAATGLSLSYVRLCKEVFIKITSTSCTQELVFSKDYRFRQEQTNSGGTCGTGQVT